MNIFKQIIDGDIKTDFVHEDEDEEEWGGYS